MRPSTGKAPLYLPLLPQGLHQPLKAGDPRQLPTAQEEDQPLFFFLPGALTPASWSQEALSGVGGEGGRIPRSHREMPVQGVGPAPPCASPGNQHFLAGHFQTRRQSLRPANRLAFTATQNGPVRLRGASLLRAATDEGGGGASGAGASLPQVSSVLPERTPTSGHLWLCGHPESSWVWED